MAQVSGWAVAYIDHGAGPSASLQPLPFAQARFCSTLPAPNGKFLSTFRSPEFGMDYGTLIVEHALMGLQARAVIVLDENDVVRHAQLVPEMTSEPDYAAALAALG